MSELQTNTTMFPFSNPRKPQPDPHLLLPAYTQRSSDGYTWHIQDTEHLDDRFTAYTTNTDDPLRRALDRTQRDFIKALHKIVELTPPAKSHRR